MMTRVDVVDLDCNDVVDLDCNEDWSATLKLRKTHLKYRSVKPQTIVQPVFMS